MRDLILDKIYDWVSICDEQAFMVHQMTSSMPGLYRGLPKYAYLKKRTMREMQQVCDFFRDILPEEHQESLVYAFILIGRGFQHDVFITSKSAKRLLSLTLALAFKVFSEIDCQSVNYEMACQCQISVEEFNALELLLVSKYDYNVGVSETEFKSQLDMLNQEAIQIYGSPSAAVDVSMDDGEESSDFISDAAQQTATNSTPIFHDLEEVKIIPCSANKQDMCMMSADFGESKIKVGDLDSDTESVTKFGSCKSTEECDDEDDCNRLAGSVLDLDQSNAGLTPQSSGSNGDLIAV